MRFEYQEADSEDAGDKSTSVSEKNSENVERAAWFGYQVPQLALWVAGRDELVDGPRLVRRIEEGWEQQVQIAHLNMLIGYEHLNVLWAMDAIDNVGKVDLETIWKTAGDGRTYCKTPKKCESVAS